MGMKVDHSGRISLFGMIPVARIGGRCIAPVSRTRFRLVFVKRSGLVWDTRNLDAWLKSPAALVPGNAMGFPGIADARTRADLVAYLEAVSTGRVSAPDRGLPNLKESDAASRVTAIRYCGDAYRLHHCRPENPHLLGVQFAIQIGWQRSGSTCWQACADGRVGREVVRCGAQL